MIYIFLALVFYSVAIVLGAFASRIANTNLVAAITNAISAIIPIIIAAPLVNKSLIQNQKVGIIAALVAGVVISLFVMSLNKAFTENKVAIVAPIVFGGSIFISAILSFIFFKEKISPVQGIGMAFLAVGLVIITYARFSGK